MQQSAQQPEERLTDGRAERSRQSRVKIADAVLALLDEGESHFPAERVAERAGVSRRLVFHHYADMSQLVETAIARRLEQLIEQIRPLPTDGPRAARVSALTEQRARILEWITPAQLTLLRLEQPGDRISEVKREVLDFARARLVEIFGEELDRAPAGRRTELLHGLDAVTTWGAWYHWRSSGLSVEAATRTMETAVHALLATTDTA
ncbi:MULTISPECIES: TetR/AcrR family transcriptional regulator [unclassified Streptomyces]|uniref:TetR/AcrR family transcriptional regulator n=1 Tax=unclassified Streptomyces TaxID=2593676 RepID=UPI002E125F83|nr:MULTISPECIES: TetR/AcrR family transcriptional regulator [unclassified Streptomyces]WSR24230.1 TetR/AcrR family transcriptional regulator [Streptomyces sp. NBC_01205]